jgi:hypothetical protein
MWRQGKIMEIILIQVDYHGWIVRHFFCYDTSSISCISDFALSFEVVFQVALESNGSHDPGLLILMRLCSLLHLSSLCTHLKTTFRSFSVTVYMPQKALKSCFPSRILQNCLCSLPHYSQ